MRTANLILVGAAIGALATASCISGLPGSDAADEPPFIDPLVLSQNRCGGAPSQALQPKQNAAHEAGSGVEFAAPFTLSDAVVQHFHYPISTTNDATQKWFDTGCCQSNANQSPAAPVAHLLGGEKFAPFEKSGVS